MPRSRTTSLIARTRFTEKRLRTRKRGMQSTAGWRRNPYNPLPLYFAALPLWSLQIRPFRIDRTVSILPYLPSIFSRSHCWSSQCSVIYTFAHIPKISVGRSCHWLYLFVFHYVALSCTIIDRSHYLSIVTPVPFSTYFPIAFNIVTVSLSFV